MNHPSNDLPVLDSIHCPLSGVHMIEAAAGTGKTYNIQNLFVRMILEGRLPIRSILVVTFTEAATAELRDRIRSVLKNMHAFYFDGSLPASKEQARILALSEHFSECGISAEEAEKRLSSALLSFDESRIFTIHGFCHRVLTENAFESGVLFTTEIVKDPSEIRMDILYDFYRKEFYSPEENLLRSELRAWAKITPESIYETIRCAVDRPELSLKLSAPVLETPFETLIPCMRTAVSVCRNHYEKGLLTGIPVPMNKGYAPDDLERLERQLTEFAEGTLESNTVSLLFSVSPAVLMEKVGRRKKENPERLASYLKHPFFESADRFCRCAELYAGKIPFEALNVLNIEFEKRKIRDNFQTYDDLLRRVDERCSDSPDLIREIRKQYASAVIDEFQDTDAVQYRIFKRIFADREQPSLFMVGDPRQAIYSFRGGDIATYRQADRERLHFSGSGEKYSLVQNFRSTPSLIACVNRIFHEHPLPFADPEIPFPEVQVPPERRDGFPEDPEAFRIVYEDRESSRGALSKRLMEQCASDLVQTLRNRDFRFPGRSESGVSPSDLAILVNTNREGELMQEILSARGVSSVRAKTGNVFQTAAALDLEKVLTALLHPGDFGFAAEALITPLLGFTPLQLMEWKKSYESGEDSAFRVQQERFLRLSEKWEKQSFTEMFQDLLLEFNIRERLLSKTGGERHLTNLLHLRELLHAESMNQERLSPRALVDFLSKKRTGESSSGQEEYEILLETDRASVTIMTVHKSKGLQFPIVFLPTLFNGLMDAREGNYHREADGVLEHDFSGDPNSRTLSLLERLQEQLRLTYVAFTRAEFRCRVYWGLCPGADRTSPLDWLFSMRHVDPEIPLRDIPGVLADGDSRLFYSFPQEWVIRNPEPVPGMWCSEHSARTLTCPDWNRSLDTRWRITSFSGLTLHADGDSERDYDESDHSSSVERSGLFSIPSGAQTGNAWHEILEKIDFCSPEEHLHSLTLDALGAYGLGRDPESLDSYAQWTEQMIRNVLSAPLSDAEGTVFTLSDIPRSRRLSELEFHYSFHQAFDTVELRRILNARLSGLFPADDPAPGAFQSFTGGFLNGVIDLLFEHNGRYYLADWKSNSLNGVLKNFEPDGLKRAMRRNDYFLQYLIYSVALLKFLRMKNGGAIDEPEFRSRFGGVFYFFLRGIDPAFPGRGIFYHQVPFALLEELEKLIG